MKRKPGGRGGPARERKSKVIALDEKRRTASKNSRAGGRRPTSGSSPPPHLAHIRTLEELPLVGPAMVQHFRRIGIQKPADLMGKSGDQLYEALSNESGSAPHRAMLYVLRMIADFVETGTRHDLRDLKDFMDENP